MARAGNAFIAAALIGAWAAPPARAEAPQVAASSAAPASAVAGHAKHRARRTVEPAGYFKIDVRSPGSAPAGRTRDDWPTQDTFMPFVSGGAPGVADRINAAIYLRYLGNAPPDKPGTDVPLPDASLASGVESGVLRNDASLLSIRFTSAACNMHCEWFLSVLHFDPRSGRRVQMADLLTPAGMALVRTEQARAGVATYAEGLARLPRLPGEVDDDAETAPDDDDGAAQVLKALQASRSKPDPIDLSQDPDGDEHRVFYQQCKGRWDNALSGADSATDEAPEFELGADGGMHVPVPQCGYDPYRISLEMAVWPPPDVVLAPQRLAPLATPYGRSLILGGPQSAAPTDLANQVVHGRIGSALVTMMLHRLSDGPCFAEYYHERYRRIIRLDGQCSTSALNFNDDGGGILELHPQGTGLSGTWRGAKRILQVTLTP